MPENTYTYIYLVYGLDYDEHWIESAWTTLGAAHAEALRLNAKHEAESCYSGSRPYDVETCVLDPARDDQTT